MKPDIQNARKPGNGIHGAKVQRKENRSRSGTDIMKPTTVQIQKNGYQKDSGSCCFKQSRNQDTHGTLPDHKDSDLSIIPQIMKKSSIIAQRIKKQPRKTELLFAYSVMVKGASTANSPLK